jgi:hypothetical protein
MQLYAQNCRGIKRTQTIKPIVSNQIERRKRLYLILATLECVFKVEMKVSSKCIAAGSGSLLVKNWTYAIQPVEKVYR